MAKKSSKKKVVEKRKPDIMDRICPACGSTNVVLREEENELVCNECGNIFPL
jgi:transcription elongation factor Elf1